MFSSHTKQHLTAIAVVILATFALAVAAPSSQAASGSTAAAHAAKKKPKCKSGKRRAHGRCKRPGVKPPVDTIVDPGPVPDPGPVVGDPGDPTVDVPDVQKSTWVTGTSGPSDERNRESHGCSDPEQYTWGWGRGCVWVSYDDNNQVFVDTDWEYWNGSIWVRYQRDRCNLNRYCWSTTY
jgi:hypothetical protein